MPLPLGNSLNKTRIESDKQTESKRLKDKWKDLWQISEWEKHTKPVMLVKCNHLPSLLPLCFYLVKSA